MAPTVVQRMSYAGHATSSSGIRQPTPIAAQTIESVESSQINQAYSLSKRYTNLFTGSEHAKCCSSWLEGRIWFRFGQVPALVVESQARATPIDSPVSATASWHLKETTDYALLTWLMWSPPMLLDRAFRSYSLLSWRFILPVYDDLTE